MRYLGIDTSGSVAAVALYDTEQDVFLSQQCLYTKKTHSQVILPLVERMLQDCDCTCQDLDGIAVAVGPGSYTGLRIGVAAVKAMTFALQIPCFGISTLESLAYQAATADGLCSPVMQARQNLIYAGLYACQNGVLQAIVPDGLYDKTEWAEKLQQQNAPVLVTGDAAGQFAAASIRIAPASVRLQNGTGLCLAAKHHTPQTPEQLEANYLQLVKAEKDRQQAAKQG